MSKANRPPSGKPWVWMTKDLLVSDAWRGLGINGHRFIQFLLVEHMSKGGNANGKLKAPYNQLEMIGIGRRRIREAIHDAEVLGLVDCVRGGMRVATTYALTWLPLHDGAAPTDRWRAYQNPALQLWPTAKIKNLPDKGTPALPDKGTPDGTNLPDKGTADRPKTLPDKGTHLLREVLTKGGTITSEPEVASGDARLPWSAPVLTELHGTAKADVLAWAASLGQMEMDAA